MMTDSIIETNGNKLEESAYIESPLKNSGNKLIATLRTTNEEEKENIIIENSILEDSIYNDQFNESFNTSRSSYVD